MKKIYKSIISYSNISNRDSLQKKKLAERTDRENLVFTIIETYSKRWKNESLRTQWQQFTKIDKKINIKSVKYLLQQAPVKIEFFQLLLEQLKKHVQNNADLEQICDAIRQYYNVFYVSLTKLYDF
eukprot:GHVL01014345.1.p1 GENE.GHVL01014345.1~~GHVL01014345.1.p1  ORF type:complete len:126 (-),score=20.79 GHVL01014345.1:426-803(-)